DDLDNCTARYSCIEDGDPGQGNISTNPLFADSNYHLLSQRGRYVLDKDYWISDKDYWILDETTSPCVDAGDPTIYPENEATPNGARVNMGAFGNTAYASLSEWPLSADINRDGTVNLLDFALFAQDFLWTAPWYE
ncbi:MAG: hypothetical protein JXD22_15360, partial [Sedimentisphaerales bacterium]|nr:hypothetical protein [Sedimentisphaerales bacterium]